jgi:ABC-type phosphate transport system permease subunit
MLTKNQKTIIVGLTVAIVFVLIGVFFLSYAMETLDVKAEELGAQEQLIYEPPFPDYSIIGIDNVWGALIIGIISTLIVFIVSLGVAKILNKKKRLPK